jgi:thiamine biosynthesis lipoprotein
MSSELRRYSMSGATMGTRYTAVFHAPPLDEAAVGAALFAAVDEVDRQMSAWDVSSDLCRLNAAPVHAWIDIPDALAHVLETGLAVGRASGGAFDMGVGALVEAWGFGPTRRNVDGVPIAPHGTAASLDLDRARGRVCKSAPVTIDLAGIAKGYGVDMLAACLDRHGIGSYLVGIDGELRARGCKPGGEPWTVAMELPSYGLRAVAGAMELSDTALATSGDYRHYVDVAGRRFSHTMDPAAGRPVTNGLAAVSVLAPTCMVADAWATALLVLGEREGARVAREQGLEALFTVRDGAGLREVWIGG